MRQSLLSLNQQTTPEKQLFNLVGNPGGATSTKNEQAKNKVGGAQGAGPAPLKKTSFNTHLSMQEKTNSNHLQFSF